MRPVLGGLGLLGFRFSGCLGFCTLKGVWVKPGTVWAVEGFMVRAWE